MCVSVHMDILVSCMNDHTFFTLHHLIVFGDKSSFPQWGPTVVKGAIVLSSCSLGASGKKMQYHAIWHSIIRHISPFPERDMVTKPTFQVSHESDSQGIFAFSFQWNIWVYYKADIWRGGQEATAGREQCLCDALYKKKKKPKIHPTVSLNCDILLSDLFPWQEPGLITLHSFSHCVSVTQTFTGQTDQHGCRSNSWQVWLARAPIAMKLFGTNSKDTC